MAQREDGFMVKKIAHIGIATRSISEAAEFYRLLGLEVESEELVEEQKVKVGLIRVGESALELLEATESDSPVGRFLDHRGEGLHHITFEVENLREKLEELRTQGIELIDHFPRRGAADQLIAFVHPRSTGGVLVELCQSREGAN